MPGAANGRLKARLRSEPVDLDFGYAHSRQHGLWRSLVARLVRDEEVGSSNLPNPTKAVTFELDDLSVSVSFAF